MRRLHARLHNLRSNRDRGATAVEYALIVAVIAIVLVVGGIALGNAIKTQFTNVGKCVATPAASCPP